MAEIAGNEWRKCSSCKKPIPFKAIYWVCNVSTCNRKRTGLAFCTVSCWDAHVPMMNHRESWAEERRAPSPEEWARVLSGEAEAEAKAVRKKEREAAESAAEAKARAEAAAKAATPASAPRVIVRRTGRSED